MKWQTHSAEPAPRERLAIWLEPEQLAFLANEWRKIPDNASDEVRRRWSDIAFRAMCALSKAGVPYEPVLPAADEQYVLPAAEPAAKELAPV